ncbi:MAG: hypothetical protein AABW54_04165 [Candidatus Micrarchaeota archaeon]
MTGFAKEFWNELLTKESWEKLAEFSKRFEFIVIGGWAAYLWTGCHKSKDIDLVVEQPVLNALREEFRVEKNPALRKYEIKFDKLDVDLYAPYYSRLAVPPEELGKYATKVQGITTVTPEVLLVLKQGAEIERRGTIKGEKDAIDLLTLLMRAPIDLGKYSAAARKYGHGNYPEELCAVVKRYDAKKTDYLGAGFKEFAGWRRAFLQEMKETRQRVPKTG